MALKINGIKVAGNAKPGAGVVAGGTSGQILTKRSNVDYDTEWTTIDALEPDLATTTTPGLVMVDGTAGIGVNTENGNLYIVKAENSDIDDKAHSYKPITPENLDYAVKAALVANANELTYDERIAVTQWINALSTNCTHKETGDITDLYGTKSCRYIIGDTVTGMPIDSNWWFVDVLSNRSTDMTVVAYLLSSTPTQYTRMCVNGVWGDWVKVGSGWNNLPENATGGVANDTVSFWVAQGTGYCWISTLDQVTDQPSQHGFLINYAGEADVFQIYRNQESGETYFRSGDSVNAWFSSWTKVATIDSEGNINVNGINTSRVYASDENGAMGLYTNGIGSGNDNVWIDAAGDAYFTEVNIGIKDNYKKAATEEYVDIRVPAWTTDDEGKFLRIVNGAPTWATVDNAEGVNF